MNIHEYQAKQLLGQYGVAVPPGTVCTTPARAKAIAGKLFAEGYKRVIVKSQIHAGGRGKGAFKTGLQGGVKLCQTTSEVYAYAQAALGQVLVTRQTGPEGRRVNKVLVECAPVISREIFVAVILDRLMARPVMMVCPAGGVDIEEIAEESPEMITREPIDPVVGLMPYQARKLALTLGLESDLLNQATKLLMGVYRTWLECDATLVEINPLHVIERIDGSPSLVAVDGKIALDDNALYRHPELQAMRDLAEESPLEVEASNYNLSYIKLDGNIACMVNGAGLAMATMDIIMHFGGKPANFYGCRRRGESRTGNGGLQDHFARPQREGHSGQYFRGHYAMRHHRSRHCCRGQGKPARPAAGGPAGGHQCGLGAENHPGIRAGGDQRRHPGGSRREGRERHPPLNHAAF